MRRFTRQDATGILITDEIDNAILGSSITVPTDGAAGYLNGCLWNDEDATAGNTLWINEGTVSSCKFRPAGSMAVVAAGSTLTLTAALHANNKIINLDTAAGSTVTLPAASGSGNIYRFRVSVIATSNNHKIQVANASDAMEGFVFTMSDDAGAPVKGYFAVAGTDDTITLNRTTTGSVTVGEQIEIVDVATNRFMVKGFTSSTGTEATPFSSAV